MSVTNSFFLVAGVMAFLFAIGHTVWGERNVLGDVRASAMPAQKKHLLLVIWNQPTVFHFLSAVALVLASLSPDNRVTHPLALFIGLVSFGFFLNYVGTSLVKNRSALAQIIPQAIGLMIYLAVIADGVILSS
jgi:hypothetical protein